MRTWHGATQAMTTWAKAWAKAWPMTWAMTWEIARGQLVVLARSPGLWAMLGVTLALDGLLFHAVALGPRPRQSAAALEQLWGTLLATTCALTPLLTMRAIPDQRRWAQGALSAARSWPLVLGRAGAVWALASLRLALTLPMPLGLWVIGKVSWGQVGAGYLGLALVTWALVGLGVLCSALSRGSAWLAALMSAAATTLWLLPWLLAAQLSPGPARQALAALSLYDALFRGFMRGQLQSQSALTLAAVGALGLALAAHVTRARRGA